MIKSLSSKAWGFLRSDGAAILLWASVVGVLARLVGVLLKEGVSLMRSDFFQPKLTPVDPSYNRTAVNCLVCSQGSWRRSS
jgi:hypothetical protein